MAADSELDIGNDLQVIKCYPENSTVSHSEISPKTPISPITPNLIINIDAKYASSPDSLASETIRKMLHLCKRGFL